MRNPIILTFAFTSMLLAQTKPSVIGKGWGLDHVIVAAPNADAVSSAFSTALGFTVLSGNTFPEQGLQQAGVRLPPTYVEFLSPYQEPTGGTLLDGFSQ